MRRKALVFLTIIFFVSVAVVSVMLSQSSNAATPTSTKLVSSDFNTPNIVSEKIKAEESSTKIDSLTDLKKVVTTGTNSINARINSLKALTKKINALKTINTDQKTYLVGLINEQINGLNSLSAKIKADTDIVVAKTDVKSIFSNFRIYAVFVPKISILKNLYLEENYLSKYYDVLLPKIQTLVTSEANKCGYVPRQSAIDQSKTVATAALGSINETRVNAMNINPTDYPNTYVSEFTAVNNSLKSIKLQLDTIRNLLKNANNYNTSSCTCDLDRNKKCNEADWTKFQNDWGKTDCIKNRRNTCACDKNNDGSCNMKDWVIFGQDWGKQSTAVVKSTNNTCIADYNDDGTVNQTDKDIFSENWGQNNCISTSTAGIVQNACECDLNNDNSCNMKDWVVFGKDWGRTNCIVPANTCECDLNNDGSCNMRDWVVFGKDWNTANTSTSTPSNYYGCDLNKDNKCDQNDHILFGEDWGRTNCLSSSTL